MSETFIKVRPGTADDDPKVKFFESTDGDANDVNAQAVVPVDADTGAPLDPPLTDDQLRASPIPVSASSLPLPTGAATEDKQDDEITILSAIESALALLATDSSLLAIYTRLGDGSVHAVVDNFPAVQPVSDNGGSLTVDGTVAVTDGGGSITVDGPLTDTQLRATAVPVVTNDTTATGTLAASNDTVTISVPRGSYVGVNIGPTTGFRGSYTAQTSGDGGTTWQFAYLKSAHGGQGDVALTVDGDSENPDAYSFFVVPSGPCTHARIRCTVRTSGSFDVTLFVTEQQPLFLYENTWLGSSDPTVGQKAMTQSIPVAIASNQSAVPISNANLDAALSTLATQATLALIKAKTDNIDVALSTRTKPADSQHVTVDNASIAVTGPLTDTQLRAAAVPVSGPLTDTQLRATAVPVAPTIERASAGDPAGVTVSTAAVLALASNGSAKSRVLVNCGTTNIFLGKSNTVTASGATMGIKLSPGGSYADSGIDLYTGDIYAIGDAVAASQNLSAWERT